MDCSSPCTPRTEAGGPHLHEAWVCQLGFARKVALHNSCKFTTALERRECVVEKDVVAKATHYAGFSRGDGDSFLPSNCKDGVWLERACFRDSRSLQGRTSLQGCPTLGPCPSVGAGAVFLGVPHIVHLLILRDGHVCKVWFEHHTLFFERCIY